jgi:hypothetical protein
VPRPALEESPSFSAIATPEEYAAYRGAGSGGIGGVALFGRTGRSADGTPGLRIVLDPATTFAKRWYAEVGLVPGQFDALPADTLFRAARRSAVTDSAGAFTFPDLPAGTYIVATLETWDIPNGNFGLRPQSGVVSHVVTLAAGQKTRVVFAHRAP